MSYIKENLNFPLGLNTLSFTTMLYNNQQEQFVKEITEELKINIRKEFQDEMEQYIKQIRKEFKDEIEQHIKQIRKEFQDEIEKHKEILDGNFVHILKN